MNINQTTAKVSIIVICTAVAGAATLMTIFSTSPKTVGPSGVTFWFIGLLVFLTGLFCLSLYTFKRRVMHLSRDTKLLLNSSFRASSLVAFAVVIFLALKSLGSLTLKDVILIGLTLVLIEFYLRIRRK